MESNAPARNDFADGIMYGAMTALRILIELHPGSLDTPTIEYILEQIPGELAKDMTTVHRFLDEVESAFPEDLHG